MAKNKTGNKNTAAEKTAIIKEKTSEVMQSAITKASEAKEAVAEKAKETVVKAKETAAKTKETASKAKEAVSKKEAPAAKAASKKDASETCFVEFSGKQISVADVTENAKKHWKASNNGTISDIKVYINTKESKAYYVVNNEDRGDFDI